MVGRRTTLGTKNLKKKPNILLMGLDLCVCVLIDYLVSMVFNIHHASRDKVSIEFILPLG
jgi:hypothetical protein